MHSYSKILVEKAVKQIAQCLIVIFHLVNVLIWWYSKQHSS